MAKEPNKILGGCTLWARQTIESDIFNTKPAKWFKIWFYVVNRANHTDNAQLKRGQCHLTYETIMLKCGATKSEVDHCIRWLKSQRMLRTSKTTRGFIVTIYNYELYQKIKNYKVTSLQAVGAESATAKATDKQGLNLLEDETYKDKDNAGGDSKSDRKATQKRHDKQECNNDNKYSSDSDEYGLAKHLFNCIRSRKPDYKERNLQTWAKYIDYMIRLDKRKPKRIREVIDWCQQDDFWQDNILSTDKLRKQFDQLELKMKKSKGLEKRIIPLDPIAAAQRKKLLAGNQA